MDAATASGSVSCRPKIRPAKTKVFFVHSPGRTETRRLTAVERRRAANRSAESETASSGCVERPTARRTSEWPSDLRRSLEALERVGFGLERLEHRQQLGDREEIGDALRQIDQLEAAPLAAHRGVGAHDLAETRAVDVRHALQVQKELLLPLMDQGVDLVLQQLVAFAQRHLALQVEHGDVANDAFLDHHGSSPPPAEKRP